MMQRLKSDALRQPQSGGSQRQEVMEGVGKLAYGSQKVQASSYKISKHGDIIGGSDGKESACIAGDPGSVPGSGRSPGEGHRNPIQCSCLENPMDRGAWRATIHGVTKNQTQLSDQYTHTW